MEGLTLSKGSELRMREANWGFEGFAPNFPRDQKQRPTMTESSTSSTTSSSSLTRPCLHAGLTCPPPPCSACEPVAGAFPPPECFLCALAVVRCAREESERWVRVDFMNDFDGLGPLDLASAHVRRSASRGVRRGRGGGDDCSGGGDQRGRRMHFGATASR